MSNLSYEDIIKLFPGAQPRIFPEIACDPVLEHCIQLRKYQGKLQHLLLLTNDLKEINDDSERKCILDSLPPIPELPELLNKSAAQKQSLNLKEIELSEETVMKLLSKSVVRVAFILGYTVMPAELLLMLSKTISSFIQSLIAIAVELTPEEDPISVDTLEVALKCKGISGIEGLYSFYLQRIVKVHEKLYSKCKHLSEDLQNNLKKPTTSIKKNVNKSRNNNEDSCDDNRNEANVEDSVCLESRERVDLFLRMKLRKSRLLSEKKNCEINSYEDHYSNNNENSFCEGDINETSLEDSVALESGEGAEDLFSCRKLRKSRLLSETRNCEINNEEDKTKMNSVFELPPNEEKPSFDIGISSETVNSCKGLVTEISKFNSTEPHCTDKSTCDSNNILLLKRKTEINGVDNFESPVEAVSKKKVRLSLRCKEYRPEALCNNSEVKKIKKARNYSKKNNKCSKH